MEEVKVIISNNAQKGEIINSIAKGLESFGLCIVLDDLNDDITSYKIEVMK